METNMAVTALAALAHETRLSLFRRLVRAGPAGLTPGVLGAEFVLPPATLSFHLKELTRAGLLQARHEGRHIHYAPHVAAMNALLGFLVENCCGGEECGLVAPCCPPADVAAE
jgi:ArsR family transcriptional regulator